MIEKPVPFRVKPIFGLHNKGRNIERRLFWRAARYISNFLLFIFKCWEAFSLNRNHASSKMQRVPPFRPSSAVRSAAGFYSNTRSWLKREARFTLATETALFAVIYTTSRHPGKPGALASSESFAARAPPFCEPPSASPPTAWHFCVWAVGEGQQTQIYLGNGAPETSDAEDNWKIWQHTVLFWCKVSWIRSVRMLNLATA